MKFGALFIVLLLIISLSVLVFSFLNLNYYYNQYPLQLNKAKISRYKVVCSQEDRFATLKKGCKKSSERYDPEDELTYRRFRVDDHHKILYCALPKAASTTLNNLVYYAITGIHPKNIHCAKCWEEAGLVFLNTFSKQERDQRLRDYYKIMVVRHPLDRLVSCWNGKLTSPRNDKVWIENGPKMIARYRKVSKNSSLEEEIKQGATFEEFLRYVQHMEKMSPKDHDPHWDPHYRQCHPCSIDYDLIIRVETLEQDSKLILNKLNLSDTKIPLLNARRVEEDGSSHFQKQLPEYKAVGQNYFAYIKDMYRIDMDLFDYHWNDTALTSSCDKTCVKGDSSCC